MARRPQRVWALCAPFGALLLAASCDLNPHPEPPGSSITNGPQAGAGMGGSASLDTGNSKGAGATTSTPPSGTMGQGAFRGIDGGMIVNTLPPPSTGGTQPPLTPGSGGTTGSVTSPTGSGGTTVSWGGSTSYGGGTAPGAGGAASGAGGAPMIGGSAGGPETGGTTGDGGEIDGGVGGAAGAGGTPVGIGGWHGPWWWW
jgi:hypothetical protein